MQTSVAVVQASWPQASCVLVLEAFCPCKEGIYVSQNNSERYRICQVGCSPTETGLCGFGTIANLHLSSLGLGQES